ncbi:hypothetical protein [Burkholderia cepacia]|uniref:hypothetical protein n=1 Tax=Burkholderia cepacia TaxID=292 RepID=UPI001F30A050|nr:hypothetical protein [Burkholderia cepacia]MCE4129519.1 hypothetical protein [Burkholderia cepacia]
MHNQFQLPPPSSWEKFERMCADIFAIEWNDPATQKHGRTGFPQNGVDVYGRTRDGRLHGIQCKKKSVGTTSPVTEKELREEVNKALRFSPKLSSFIFAATSPNDPDLELVAREITQKHAEENLFSVHFLGWDEILDKLWQYDHLIRRYYEWALPDGDPNNYAFGLWSEQFSSNYLFKNACYLPFRSHQVSFRPSFIEKLCSFHNEAAVLLDDQRIQNLDEKLRGAIENFNMVASDLIDNAAIDCNRPDAFLDVYAYWVDKGDLPYHQQRDYVEYKKLVLKYLFHGLIVAANHIIDVKNKISGNRAPVHPYVKFRQTFDWTDADEIPMYSQQEMNKEVFYPGIKFIKEMASKGMNDPVLDYEKAIGEMRQKERQS